MLSGSRSESWIFFLSVSDIPRARKCKSPSSVKLEYCYYKLIISHLCEAFSFKKKKVEICYTRKLACSIKHGKFLFWLNLKWTESSCLSHEPLNLQSHLIKNPTAGPATSVTNPHFKWDWQSTSLQCKVEDSKKNRRTQVNWPFADTWDPGNRRGCVFMWNIGYYKINVSQI